MKPSRWALALLCLSFALVAPAAEPSLDQAFDQLKAYNDGQPNQALAVIERFVGRVSMDAEQRPKAAERLAGILADPQTSTAAKLFACQQLKVVAHDAQVPLLAKMLDDPKTADMARIVLQTMPGEDATRALIAALNRTTGDTLVGVINSVGARRAASAITPLKKLAGQSDQKVAAAAAAALGKIGTANALGSLSADALLECADGFAAAGERTRAAALYRSGWGADRPPLRRMTALAGIARVAPDEALPWIIDALHSSNEQLQGLAAETARILPGAEATAALGRELAKLKGTVRVLLLGTLAERGERSAFDSLLALAKDKDDPLRNIATGELRRLRTVTKDVTMLERADATLGAPAISVQTLDPEPYAQAVIQQRKEQVAKTLAAGDRLLCFLDCGVEARAESGGVTLRQIGGRAHQFPGSEQTAHPTLGTVGWDAPKVDFEIAGLDSKKHYAMGFSWWDYDSGSRVQSVRFTGGDPARTEVVLKDTPLPRYTATKQGPAIGQLPIPSTLHSNGKLRVSVNRTQGPNAVVSEMWVVEASADRPTAMQARLDGAVLLSAAALNAPVNLDPPAEGTKVLLVTGIDYPGHPWPQTAPVLKELLEKDARLKVRIVEDPNALGSPKLKLWDVVIIHFMDWETPGPGPDARENLKQFVAGGKGMMLTHFACGAWDTNEWPEFRNLAGRVWDPKLRPHDPHGKFTVEIADKDHPITKGMAPFETIDELYTCLAGEAPIHIVAKATSKVDQKDYPMAFVLDYGKGRVFHTPLGHDARAYTNNPAVGELMRRGGAWAAGLPVTQ